MDFIKKKGDNMPTTKAQQKAVNKYVKKNYDRIEIKTPKGRKTEIKNYAEYHGESMNAFIVCAINERMQKAKKIYRKSSSKNLGDKYPCLSSDTVKTAQEAAKASGETISQFIARAVNTQAKRDKVSIRMGLSPITQESHPNNKKQE